MPSNVRIECKSGLAPVLVSLLLFVLAIVGLAILRLEWRVELLLMVALILSLLWALLPFFHQAETLIYRSGMWLVKSRNNIVNSKNDAEWPAVLLPASFLSSYLLVLVFYEPENKQRFHFWISRANCDEADFRHLCRLLYL